MWRVIIAEVLIIVLIVGILYLRSMPSHLSSAAGVKVVRLASYECDYDAGHCLNGIAYDARDDSLYAVDLLSQQVVRISAAGREIVLAGVPYDPLDSGCKAKIDGQGSRATFCGVNSIVADPADGSLIVTDTGNRAIRRVTLQGAVTTIVAGDRERCVGFYYSERHICGPRAIAIDPTTSNMYVTQGQALFRVDPKRVVSLMAGADPVGEDLGGCLGHDGKGEGAVFCGLDSVAAWHGDVIVAEGMGRVIDRVADDGRTSVYVGERTTYEGSAASGFFPALPIWLQLLHATCRQQDGVLQVARICGPSEVTTDGRTGTTYFADAGSIRSVDAASNVATVLAGQTYPCSPVTGDGSHALACEPGNFALDSTHHRLYFLDRDQLLRVDLP